jgi:hypothetical protein
MNRLSPNVPLGHPAFPIGVIAFFLATGALAIAILASV